MLAKLCGFGAVGFLMAGTLCAQLTSVVAKIRQTDEVIVNGKVSSTHVQEGIFYRASSGSELRQWKTIDGKEATGAAAWASLTDKQHESYYKVDYVGRQAYQTIPPEISPPKDDKAPKSVVLGHDSVEGIACELLPIRVLAAGKAPVEVGRSCRSAEYDLRLYAEFTNPVSVNKSVHSTLKLYDIQLGVEPDQSFFDLQTNFTVHKVAPMQ